MAASWSARSDVLFLIFGGMIVAWNGGGTKKNNTTTITEGLEPKAGP
jgi:hypothetical protein